MIDSAPAKQSDPFISLGAVQGVFGVKGWVKVFSYTSPIENILNYKIWYIKQQNTLRKIVVKDGKRHGKGIIAKLEGVDDRDVAAKLIKAEIVVYKSSLPKLEDDEYYWDDLIGLEVFNLDSVFYGHVEQMLETGVNDVMVVKIKDKERLIPFIQKMYIKNIDLSERKIIVDWPEDFD